MSHARSLRRELVGIEFAIAIAWADVIRATDDDARTALSAKLAVLEARRRAVRGLLSDHGHEEPAREAGRP